MVLRVTSSLNGVKVYDIAAGKQYPAWLSKTRRRKL
ncbi:hypothetical protein KIPB_013969, partial [Kipferlia bialata]|eukprot:g13969.t1